MAHLLAIGEIFIFFKDSFLFTIKSWPDGRPGGRDHWRSSKRKKQLRRILKLLPQIPKPFLQINSKEASYWETVVRVYYFKCMCLLYILRADFKLHQTKKSEHYAVHYCTVHLKVKIYVKSCGEPAISPCFTGPVDYPFASRHKGPKFKSPGVYSCETGILLIYIALSRSNPIIEFSKVNFCFVVIPSAKAKTTSTWKVLYHPF